MIYLKFLWTLLKHKYFVFCAGLLVGVPVWHLIIHDWSKFLPIEFFKYARNFHVEGTESKPHEHSADFAYAWLHHENINPHHWAHWVPRSGSHANKPLPMPEIYVRELVADCMSAGKTYTDSWNIAPWLNKNGSAWLLHEQTVDMIHNILLENNYVITDNCPWSLLWTENYKAR